MAEGLEIPAALQERVRKRIRIDPATGCWLWTGGRFNNGYARMASRKRRVLVHRYVYETLKHPIPDGLVIDHLCRVRLCLNPDHLEPVTDRVNLLRGVGPTRINADKTHCVHGHEFTPENTYWDRGCRQCRTCRIASALRWYHKARG